MSTNSKLKGFTLVELLVVVSIIAVLSSVVMSSLTTARSKSNDTKRITDLLQMRTALELYYNANSGYPVTAGWQSQCASWGGYAANNVIPGLVSGAFMPSFPADPQMNTTANTCCYLYRSNGTDYKILDHNCASGGPNASPNAYNDFVDRARDGGTSCSATTDGTAPWAWAIWTSSTSACW